LYYLNGYGLLASSDLGENGSEKTVYAGLYGTIIKAYQDGLNLKLRPDDVWIAITGVFSKYIMLASQDVRNGII